MTQHTTDPITQFQQERRDAIAQMAQDEALQQKSLDWMLHADKYKYNYNFSWMGRPIIKYPNDIVILQELIWQVKPDLIIETGIAHGGSIIFSASMLELLGKGEVLAIDIDIRQHNRREIEAHPMYKRITMIEGSSVDSVIFEHVQACAEKHQTVMVCLDSNHTHDHVLEELRLYSQLVTPGSYLVLPDTFIEHFPKGYYADRPWDVGNNPMTAMRAFLAENDAFAVDTDVCNKLLITEGFDGYLKRVK